MTHLDVTYEQERDGSEDDDYRIIQTNRVRIFYNALPYYAATMIDPAEGGYVEFDGASVLGNQGAWITLRPCDPLYQWAERYFQDWPEEFENEERDPDEARERRFDDQMERRA